MKLISLWEPWATLWVLGAKKIETRSWYTSYRGWLAVHAAKGGLPKSELRSYLSMDVFKEALGDTPLSQGKIVGLVNVKGCLSTESLLKLGVGHQEQAFGNYGPLRFGWVTNHRFRLKRPIPFRGMQGLVEVPPDVLAELRKQWTEQRWAQE